MDEKPIIILGADHAGFRLKERVAEHLKAQGYTIEDVGCYNEQSVDYPSIAGAFAQAFAAAQEKRASQNHSGTPINEPLDAVRGILCCGSGIGICMSANRFPWIRAVVAHDHNSAVMSRRHNDANVLCLGGRIIAPELAFEILDTWLATAFDGGRHQRRIDQMTALNSESLPVDPKEAPTC